MIGRRHRTPARHVDPRAADQPRGTWDRRQAPTGLVVELPPAPDAWPLPDPDATAVLSTFLVPTRPMTLEDLDMCLTPWARPQ